jgi:hypothetical protein
MSLYHPPHDPMMNTAPAKKEFHFAGGNIWRNATILADTIEEAEKLWHATKQLINPSIPVLEAPVEQSTAAPEPKTEEKAAE